MRGSRTLALLIAVLGLALAGAVVGAAPASADVVWLCKPGESPDPCVGDLTTTDQAAGGRVTTPAVPADPRIDCFYVYPTVSEQPGVSSDKAKDPSVVAIAQYQAQQYSRDCRVFAPVYRQRTLAGIYGASAEQSRQAGETAYGDVLEAFRAYLAQSDGRGFVVIGHSQGAGILRRLLREQVDPDPALRARLVSAILLGGNVAVRRGQGIGGDFQHIPACRGNLEIGCVVAFSTFYDDPPANARFGVVPAADTGSLAAGTPVGPDYEVLCTNPADLPNNSRAELSTLVRADPYPGIIGAGLGVTYGGTPPTAATPWLRPADRYTGACVTTNGARVLKLEPVGSARRLEPFPDPTWGVHLTDANIAQEQLVGLVGQQADVYLQPPACPVPAVAANARLRPSDPCPPYQGCVGAAAACPGPPYVPSVPPAPAPLTKVQPTLTVRIRPAAGRKVTTTVALTATQGRRCDGSVRVTLYAAGGRRLTRRTLVLRGCSTAPTVRFARRRAGTRISAAVSYLGGSQLLPRTGRTGTVTVRR